VRTDPYVRTGRGACREPEGGPGRRHRLCHQPAAGRRALPSGAAGRRDARWLRRRHLRQEDAAELGGGGMSTITRGAKIRDPWKHRVESADWEALTPEVKSLGGPRRPQLLTRGDAEQPRRLDERAGRFG